MIKHIYEEINIPVNDENYGDSLKNNLYQMTKWEYLYHKLKSNPNLEFKKRYQNLLKQTEKGMEILLKEIALSLGEVFQDWLSKHAIMQPHTWAVERMNNISESGSDISDPKGAMEELDVIVSEAVRYFYNNKKDTMSVDRGGFEYTEFNDAVSENNEVLELISDWLIEAYKESIDNYEDDEENKKEMQKTLDDRDLSQIFNWFRDVDGEDNIWTSIFGYLISYASDILVGLYEYIVFPAWFDYWSQEGIEETRERIEKIELSLRELDSMALQEKIESVNIAINASHQTGSMLDYISNNYDIDKAYLNYLSNIPQSEIDEWEAELKAELNERRNRCQRQLHI